MTAEGRRGDCLRVAVGVAVAIGVAVGVAVGVGVGVVVGVGAPRRLLTPRPAPGGA